MLISFVPLNLRSAFRQVNRLLQSTPQSQMWTSYFQLKLGEILWLVVSTAIVSDAEGKANIHWTLQEATQLQATLTKMPSSNHADAHTDVLAVLGDYPLHCYDKGDLIPLSSQSIWIVKQGLVKLTTFTLNNEEVVLSLVGSRLPFTVGSGALYTYQAIAVTDVQLINLSLVEIEARSDLGYSLLLKFQQRLQQTEVLLNVVGQRRTHERLYHLLQLLKQEIGQAVEGGTRLSVRLTHEELANLCCTTRVTMTRMLGALQQQGEIRFDGKFFIILNEGYW